MNQVRNLEITEMVDSNQSAGIKADQADIVVYDNKLLLDRANLAYQDIDCYYQVGERPNYNWMICISIAHFQLQSLLEKLILILAQENTCFSVARDRDVAHFIGDGSLGDEFFAKPLIIYPNNNINAERLAELLVQLTQSYRGPAIPSGSHLGGKVYALPTPGTLPELHTWPFVKLAQPQFQQKAKFFKNDEYRVVSMLKDDVKGRVFKAVRFKGFGIQWCVIKEGRRDMSLEESGRDIRDRLAWQYQLHNDLYNVISIPKAYEMFHENGDAYLVMEFIKGKPMLQVINESYNGYGTWYTLPVEKRKELIRHLLEIVSLIIKLHQKGYIHRDITPVNIMFDKNKKQWTLIDLELMFHFDLLKIPFQLGTEGYASPEQWTYKQPDPVQDTYSIGALMMTVVTNQHMSRFSTDLNDQLLKSLLFFTKDVTLSSLIASCLHHDPLERPALAAIAQTLESYSPATSADTSPSVYSAPDVASLVDMTRSVLKNPLIVSPDKVWLSNVEMQRIGSQKMARQLSFGLHTGIAGVLYFLHTLREASILIDDIEKVYHVNYQHLEKCFLSGGQNLLAGLYHGASGIALTLAKIQDEQRGISNDEVRKKIQHHLEGSSDSLTLADGIAGQGVAILQCMHHLDEVVALKTLQHNVELLINNQHRDGSWSTGKVKLAGFDNGVAGIVYFLLMYYSQYKDTQVGKAIAKALHWLQRHVRRGNVSQSFAYGVSGMAFCFLKAWQIMKDPLYKTNAERGLQLLPKKDFLCEDLTFSYGITGIAEVYLEAAHTFNSEEWLEHTDWIATLLCYRYKQKANKAFGHWTIQDQLPTADFMAGNCGILHFLFRKQLSGMPFPLFNSMPLSN